MGRVENIVGKGEDAGYPMFSGAAFVRHKNKGQDCVIKGQDVECILSPFPNKPWFLRVCSTSLLKRLWEKESNFFFSHNVFYLFGKLSAIFIEFEIVVCKLFEFGRV